MDLQAKPTEKLLNDTPVLTPENDGDPATVKPAWYWIKDANGFGSVTVTMVFVSFWVTTLAYIASLVDHVGNVSIRPFDVAACGTYFIPILGLYFGRKFTDAKFNATGK